MARTTKTTRASGKRDPEPAPKKRPGRPAGSKNRTAAPARAKTAPAAVARRAVAKTPVAPAAPKLNKAELEHQVMKLERTIARLRKQNGELKQTARDDVEAAKPAAPAAAVPDRKPKPAIAPKTPKRATAPKTRRSAKTVAEPDTAASEAEEDDASPAD